MVRAVFTPKAELTLFLRMRTKEIAKTAKMYSERRVIYLLQEICVAEANGDNRFLTGSFQIAVSRMRGENMCKTRL